MQKNNNNQGECASLAYKVKSDYAYLTILVKTEVYFELKVEIIAFGARAPPSCSTTACDVTGLVRSNGLLILLQYSNISISLHFIYLYIGNHFTK